MRAVIELKRDVDPQRILAALYKYTDMQVTFGVNIMAIAGGKPEQLGIKRAIEYYIQHQETVVTRRTQYELDQAKARLHILEGLIIAVDNLDEVIRIIRAAKNDREAKANLMVRFDLTDIQTQAILDLRLRRLTGLEILSLRAEHAKVVKEIARLEGILGSRRKLMNVIKSELSEIKEKFADARRTQLIREKEEHKIVLDETPEPEEAIVFMTQGGQLRRMHPKFYEKLTPPEDDKDRPQMVFETLSDATLYFFTDLGNCYPLAVASLPETNRPKDRGTLLTGLLAGLAKGEALVRMFCLRPGELETLPDLLFITTGGSVKRTEATAYAVRKTKFAAISLKGEDRLLDVQPIATDSLLLVTVFGMVVHFPIDQISTMGRTTAGVRGMTVDPNDHVLFAIQPVADEGELLLMSDRGYAKKSLLLDFELQNRAGKGLKGFTFQKNGANGTRVAGALYVREPFTFLVRQTKSAPTAMSTEDVHIEARAGKGQMYVMALMDDTVTGLERDS